MKKITEKERGNCLNSHQITPPNIPDRYKNAVLNDFQGELFKIGSDFLCGGYPTGFLLIGKTGTGKTHFACSLLKRFIEDRCSEYSQNFGFPSRLNFGQYITLNAFIRKIKSCWGKESQYSEDEILKYYSKTDCLVFDEVGVQWASQTELIYVNELINNRYNYFLPTILIANCTIKELSSLLGDRVIDRFKDGGKVVVFDGESKRGKI